MVEQYVYNHTFHAGERSFDMPAFFWRAKVAETHEPTILHIPGYGDRDHATKLLMEVAEKQNTPGVSVIVPFHRTPMHIADSPKARVERVARELVPALITDIGKEVDARLPVVTSSIGSAIAAFALEEIGNSIDGPIADIAAINPAGLAHDKTGRVAPTTARFLARYFKAVGAISPFEAGVNPAPLVGTLIRDTRNPWRFAGQLSVINEATITGTLRRHASLGNRVHILSGERDVLFPHERIVENVYPHLKILSAKAESQPKITIDIVDDLRHSGGMMPEFASTVHKAVSWLRKQSIS